MQDQDSAVHEGESRVALGRWHEALTYTLLLEHMPHGNTWSAEWRARRDVLGKLKALVPPGLYRHFKSTEEYEKLYVVLGISTPTEGGGLSVQCSARYEPYENELAYRPLLGGGGFLYPVYDQKTGLFRSRFTFLRPLRESVTDFLVKA